MEGPTPGSHLTPGLQDYSKIYEQLSQSYRAIDDFRMKLLGLLPLTTSGIFLLADKTRLEAALPIGIFGLVITAGLFAYELHGIKKCNRLIHAGQHLEFDHFNVVGQFRSRAHDFEGFSEPFAASIIYPASMAAWVFLAGYTFTSGNQVAIVALTVVAAAISLGTSGWSRQRIRKMEDFTNSQCQGDRAKLEDWIE